MLLFQEVEKSNPEIYDQILHILRPHPIDSVARVLDDHLKKNVTNLDMFNKYRKNIPRFLLRYVQLCQKNFPQPGEPYGIHLTCRISKTDTQETLDSKHLKNQGSGATNGYNVVGSLKYEIELFSNPSQIYELAPRRKYSSIYVTGYTIGELFDRLEDCCHLKRNNPKNKAQNRDGQYRYLSTFQYILVSDKNVIKILYTNSKQLTYLMRRLDPNRIVALTDHKKVLKKCGLLSYVFNMIRIIKTQHFSNEMDVLTVAKYQIRTGIPLPLNRIGLANDENKSPIDVLSFEALKKNCAYLSAKYNHRNFVVKSSLEKIFCGQQFNEGTGYKFALLPKYDHESKEKISEANNEGKVSRKRKDSETETVSETCNEGKRYPEKKKMR